MQGHFSFTGSCDALPAKGWLEGTGSWERMEFNWTKKYSIPYGSMQKKTPGWAWGLAGHQSVGGEQLLVHHLHIYMIKIAVRYFFPCYVCPSKQLLSHPTRSTLLFRFSDSLPYFLGEGRRVSKELCVQCWDSCRVKFMVWELKIHACVPVLLWCAIWLMNVERYYSKSDAESKFPLNYYDFREKSLKLWHYSQ